MMTLPKMRSIVALHNPIQCVFEYNCETENGVVIFNLTCLIFCFPEHKNNSLCALRCVCRMPNARKFWPTTIYYVAIKRSKIEINDGCKLIAFVCNYDEVLLSTKSNLEQMRMSSLRLRSCWTCQTYLLCVRCSTLKFFQIMIHLFWN